MDIQANYDVSMIRATLGDMPQFTLPEGYILRCYQPGDEDAWLAVQAAADKHNTFSEDTFTQQFGDDVALLQSRQFYLCDVQEHPIATATAWFNDDYQGLAYGRIHWVALLPNMQGKGLSKPLMTAACNQMRELGHERAYLTTASARLPAIGLYLKFGFVPNIQSKEDEAIWEQILAHLKKRAG